jgi:2-polyprenyl-3-methyl-5-hydroxy-6-metoxy-1,4-benzoquinol methylase
MKASEDGRRQHWEKIYETKPLDTHGWYQPVPIHSLGLIELCALDADAAIIDIGGGDSLLVDHLVEMGYHRITVLDIAGVALENARRRLAEKSNSVEWIQTDVLSFAPSHNFQLWHDRATFHFLLSPADIQAYMRILHSCVSPGGYVIMGTFSEMGPKTCSGLPIHQ